MVLDLKNNPSSQENISGIYYRNVLNPDKSAEHLVKHVGNGLQGLLDKNTRGHNY